MNRSTAILLAVVVLAMATVGIWLTLGSFEPGPKVGTAPGQIPTDVLPPPRTLPGETARRSTAGVDDPEGEHAAVDGVLSGRVLSVGGRPIAGAEVAVLAPRADETSALMRRMRNRARSELGSITGRSGDIQDIDWQQATQNGMDMGMEFLEEAGSLTEMFDLVRRMAVQEFADDDRVPVAITRTSSAGRFRFEGLAEGSYDVRARAAGHQQRSMESPAGVEELEIKLFRGATVSGVVTGNGRALPGARVLCPSGSVETGPDGAFEHTGVPPGTTALIVTAKDHVGAVQMVDASLDAPVEGLTIELVPAGAITGRVTTTSGIPVAGADVGIAPKGAGPMMFMEFMDRTSLLRPVPRAVTDADGAYTLECVPAGVVTVAARASRHLQGRRADVEVRAGATTSGADITLDPAATLVGRITGPDGAPVVEARVQVTVPPESGMDGLLAQFTGGRKVSARTDADGRYRVESIPAGEHAVGVEAAGFLSAEATLAFRAGADTQHDVALVAGHVVGGVVRAPDGTPVAGADVAVKWSSGDAPNPMAAFMPESTRDQRRVTSGEDGRFAADGLQEGPYTITAVAKGYVEGTTRDVLAGDTEVVVALNASAVLRGRVVAQETGEPVGGAWVLYRGGARRATGNPWMQMMQGDPKVLTGADGTFEISGVEGATFTLYARRKDYADSEKVKVPCESGEVKEGIQLALPVGVTLAGRVVAKGTGEPVAGALVFVPRDNNPFATFSPQDFAGGGGRTAPPNSISAQTGDDGTFQLTGLSAGRVTLHARAQAHCDGQSGADVPGPELVVELGRGGTVRGRATDEQGRPRSGMRVMLQRGMLPTGMVSTDGSGEFVIEHVTPGSYNCMLMGGESLMPEMKSATVREGEETVVDFTKEAPTGARVSGRVTQGGEPLAGATVVLTGGGQFQAEVTGDDGAYAFEGVKPGEYTVMVQRGMMGGGSDSRKLTVADETDLPNVDIAVSVLKVEGRVVDAETGEPVRTAHVVLVASNSGGATSLDQVMSEQKGQSFTDGEGRFAMEGVPVGSFTLRVSASGYPLTHVEGVAAGGAPLTVRLSAGTTIRIRLVDADGQPVAQGNVFAEDPSGRETIGFDMNMRGITDADGVAEMQLRPGTYTFHGQAADSPSASVQAATGAGEVVIRLPRGGSVTVKVVDAAGQPVAGAEVKFLDAAGKELTRRLTMDSFLGAASRTDDRGSLVRTGLPLGTVTVRAVSPGGSLSASMDVDVVGAGTAVQLKLE